MCSTFTSCTSFRIVFQGLIQTKLRGKIAFGELATRSPSLQIILLSVFDTTTGGSSCSICCFPEWSNWAQERMRMSHSKWILICKCPFFTFNNGYIKTFEFFILTCHVWNEKKLKRGWGGNLWTWYVFFKLP